MSLIAPLIEQSDPEESLDFALLLARTRPAWMSQAKCRDYPAEWWFPTRGAADMIQRAKAICAECPVLHECQDYADENHERFGIWGGGSVDWHRRKR